MGEGRLDSSPALTPSLDTEYEEPAPGPLISAVSILQDEGTEDCVTGPAGLGAQVQPGHVYLPRHRAVGWEVTHVSLILLCRLCSS